MKLSSLIIDGIRCFGEQQLLKLSPTINLVVGPNNSGKSTLVRAIGLLQGLPSFTAEDIHAAAIGGSIGVYFDEPNIEHFLIPTSEFEKRPNFSISFTNNGPILLNFNGQLMQDPSSHQVLSSTSPKNFIVPFLANRRSRPYDENVTATVRSRVDGTFSNLYSLVDEVVSSGSGHEDNKAFVKACLDILGLEIATASGEVAKRAGFYFQRRRFIPLDRMGDGIAQMLGLIVRLTSAEGKLFLIEEPENDLHPAALKSLLRLCRKASEQNQFFITTHSNVVIRELAGAQDAKIFRLERIGNGATATTNACELGNDAAERRTLLSELGYEFSDVDLWKGWLFCEEPSAEEIIRELLIPWFVPELTHQLRTYAAQGTGTIKQRFADFNSLIVFLHLEPAYKNRVWVTADGDEDAKGIVDDLKKQYVKSGWQADAFVNFSKPAFECYLPAGMQAWAGRVLAIRDWQQKRKEKQKLVKMYIAWAKAHPEIAKESFESIGTEVVGLLRSILEALKA